MIECVVFVCGCCVFFDCSVVASCSFFWLLLCVLSCFLFCLFFPLFPKERLLKHVFPLSCLCVCCFMFLLRLFVFLFGCVLLCL